MTEKDYRRNHYVPQWYQHRFLPGHLPEKKFFYLDLHPEVFTNSQGRKHTRKALLRWGPPKCFCQDDLYTTKFDRWESTEIERKFFGKIDDKARDSIDYLANFEHPSVNYEAFNNMMLYLSVQKLRTPKGLDYLSSLIDIGDENLVLLMMQRLQYLYAAIWTESIWSIADASQTKTKFIISDHPVTVYNEGCFPFSKWCKGYKDPEIWLSGTHTVFPLCLDKILIMTNLSWVRNPYSNPRLLRPNPNPLRPAVFNFMSIQTGRILCETEVNEINFIIKRRAYRYIAAAEEEWLYPEKKIPSQNWDKLGRGYLLMPDPRSVVFSRGILIGYTNNRADAFDEYGRQPWQSGYRDDMPNKEEWGTFQAFQGEFARVFGPKRRGRAYEFGELDNIEDSPDFHAYHLSLEKEYKRFRPKRAKKRG
jgi:hypothetical protein